MFARKEAWHTSLQVTHRCQLAAAQHVNAQHASGGHHIVLGGATLGGWFGVSDPSLPRIFPNLAKFTLQRLQFL